MAAGDNGDTEGRGFLAEILAQLRASFEGAFGLISEDTTDMAELAAAGMHHLVVSVIILAVVGAVYLGLRALLARALRRHGMTARWLAPLVVVLRYLAFIVAALLIMAQFGADEAMISAVARAALVALIFYLAWMLSTGVLLQLLARYDLDRSVEQLLRNVVAVLIVAFGIVTVLSQFGFDILSVIAGLGIVGLAVGFAAQSTLANIIAGVTLLIERPFRIGDWVEINGQTGKVMQIALRTTRLRTRDNIYTIIPNASVSEADIINFSAGGPLRVRIPFGIAYKESAKAARAVVLPILEAHELVLKEPDMMPAVPMTALGDSSVDMAIVYWLDPENIDIQPRISNQILEATKEALDEAGIEIPFPHLQVFVDGAKALEPLVRPLVVQRQS